LLASTYFITYFHHRHLLLPTSTYFITYFRHHHLLSFTFAIIAYSCLLPPLPLTCSRLCHLFLPTSTIATYMFSPSPPIFNYFHHCHIFRHLATCLPILIVGMFELWACPLCSLFPHPSICVGDGT
jgi:hypothetical protein